MLLRLMARTSLRLCGAHNSLIKIEEPETHRSTLTGDSSTVTVPTTGVALHSVTQKVRSLLSPAIQDP
jgi:hypothetical protein